jgi:tetratricopeptide (TPR) repeat protein
MPLYTLSGPDALVNRKSNPVATWGNRTIANRVEPVAKPKFDVPFQLQAGESIFTVGSCFARNVETQLMQRGFRIPVRELFKRPEFMGLEVGIVNNFGTPSIYNEFAWAFGEKQFVPEQHILEAVPGKFVDLHLVSSVRPESWELVLARREAIRQAYQAAKDCRIIIITLGLIEIWYDAKTTTYLNSAPKSALIKAEPNRFQMHVLSYEEAYRYLEDALLMIKKHGRSDVQVLLTVSPVPLMLTHRQQDVMVANTYSKSVLRAIAEAVVARHSFITYFPSYESVILSDRKLTWHDDFTHVTDEIVSINITRMVDAYVDAGACATNSRAHDLDLKSPEAATEMARIARAGSREKAIEFFKAHGDHSKISLEFALEHAVFLNTIKDFSGARDALSGVPELAKRDLKVVMLLADAHAGLKEYEIAFKLLDALAVGGMKANSGWTKLLRNACAMNDPNLVTGVLARWSRVAPGRTGRANALVGRWFVERGEIERGLSFLKTAVNLDALDALAKIYLADAQLAFGHRDAAIATLANVRPVTPGEHIQAERLRSLLGR